MNKAAIHKYCLSLTAATYDVKWEVDGVYSVGGRMFAVAVADKDGRAQVSFKVDEDLFLQYTDREGFMPAPYLARAKWVQIQDTRKVSAGELKQLLARSHALVAMKLTRKVRAALGIETPIPAS
ncbi:MAG: MmcQ/YjbR family DNA-binding protein [Betaproteobacteria bacterium]|nr:MmcQ/YjbR family DNA-binding protein [Betaproteobacteria bacterium]